MQNQLRLFECTTLEKDLSVVWKQLTGQQTDKATLLLATLIVRSAVAANCDKQPPAEVQKHNHE